MAVLSKVANIAVQPQPVGVVEAFAGSNAPNGWLICDGSQVSRALFPELFSVIGTQYGSGDGFSTFTLPDLRGRTIAGRDGVNNMNNGPTNRLTSSYFGASGTALGNSGGSESNTLTIAQMPSHRHEIQENSGNGSLLGGHFTGAGQTASYAGNINSTAYPAYIRNTGGNGAHNNTQPTMILNYIIKAVSELPRGGWYNSSSPDLVTSLPTNPYVGQEVYHQQTIVGTNYIIHKRYDGSTWQSITPDPTPNWTNVSSFLNGWTNYGGGWEVARYTKDPTGNVFIEGLVRSGTLGTVIFVLPTGYRPSAALIFASVANNGFCRIDIGSNGNVVHNTGGTNAFVSVACSFKASL